MVPIKSGIGVNKLLRKFKCKVKLHTRTGLVYWSRVTKFIVLIEETHSMNNDTLFNGV